MIAGFKKGVTKLAQVTVTEGGIIIPRWVVILLATCLLGMTTTAVGAGIVTWSRTDANSTAILDHEKRIEKLENTPLEVAGIKVKIDDMVVQQNRMDDKLDKLLEMQNSHSRQNER